MAETVWEDESVHTKIYVLNQRQEETCDAAGKAMRDVFSVLSDRGSKVIWSIPKHCKKFLKVLDFPYLALFLLLRAGREDFVFYSIPENHAKIKLLKKMQGIRKYQLICFINDLNAFRYGVLDAANMKEEEKEELRAVKAADYVLVPNRNAEEMLRGLGVKAKLVPVGIWDYLMSEDQSKELQLAQQNVAEKEAKAETTIAFAGNLNKSEFLAAMDIPQGIRMELWGKLEEEKQKRLPQGCHYHGVLSSEEIPRAICTMDYGLVWDGQGKDGIEGGLGEYLRYNNSHKCALYLASGVPAIVWSESGMAHFIEEHQCGITITRLSELPEKIRQADYEKLKAHALEVAPKLQQGQYLRKALGTIVDSAC